MWVNLCANGDKRPPTNVEGCPKCGADAWVNNVRGEKDCSKCGYHRDKDGKNWRHEEE